MVRSSTVFLNIIITITQFEQQKKNFEIQDSHQNVNPRSFLLYMIFGGEGGGLNW